MPGIHWPSWLITDHTEDYACIEEYTYYGKACIMQRTRTSARLVHQHEPSSAGRPLQCSPPTGADSSSTRNHEERELRPDSQRPDSWITALITALPSSIPRRQCPNQEPTQSLGFINGNVVTKPASN